MAKKVTTAPKRGKRARDDKELRRLVREACEREFEKRFGRPWSSVAVRVSRYERSRSTAIELEAREVFRKLRAAMLDAVRFAHDPKIWGPDAPLAFGGGGVAQVAGILHSWVPRSIEPVTKHAWLQEQRWRPIREGRATLAHVLDIFNIFALPPHANGPSRFLTAREMAIVSLLVDNWPSMKRDPVRTPAEVIKIESNLMREHIKRHGYSEAFGKVIRGPVHPGARAVRPSHE